MFWREVKYWLRHEPDQTIGLASGAVAIVLAVLADAGFTLINWILTAIAATLMLLLAGNVRDRLSKRSGQTVFATDEIPYARLREHISRHAVRQVVFLQYSGQACANVIEAVLRKPGTHAIVYLQDERTAAKIGSKFQADRITNSINNLRVWNRKYCQSELTVYKCAAPMTVRAVMIDDRLLCMGPYTYEPEKGLGKHPDDTVEISGNDICTMIAAKGTENFEALNTTFAMLVRKYQNAAEQVLL